METKDYQFTKEGIAELEKIARESAENTSSSLSKFINREIEVKAIAVRAMLVEKVTGIIGDPEEIVTTVTMEVRGGVNGNIMIVYTEQSAINVADLLAGRELGTTMKLSELDKSAIKESGNIISGAFLAATSDNLLIDMVESVPSISTGMLSATIDSVLANFAKREASEAMAFEVDFEMGTKESQEYSIKSYFVVLLDEKSVTNVIEAIKKKRSS
jgi:chemotaxis protein CheC